MSIVLSEDVALEVDKILIEIYSDEESESGESENEGSDNENEASKCVSKFVCTTTSCFEWKLAGFGYFETQKRPVAVANMPDYIVS